MGLVKNFKHGRIRLESGDATPLTKTVPFEEGNLSWNRPKTVVQIKTRGVLDHLQKGAEEAITLSFSAKFANKTLQRTVDQFVWDAQTELLTGLTGGALNSPVATAYPYEQGSLQVASTESGFTKLTPPGTTPTSGGEFSEAVGALDVEAVTKVPAASGLEVFMPAADTDLNIVFDAVGKSTLNAADSACPSDIKTLRLVFEILSNADLATIEETVTFEFVAFETPISFEEGEEFDLLSFEAIDFEERPTIT